MSNFTTIHSRSAATGRRQIEHYYTLYTFRLIVRLIQGQTIKCPCILSFNRLTRQTIESISVEWRYEARGLESTTKKFILSS